MFKGKRGLEYTTYYSIWQMIALVMVIVIMLVAIRGLANNTTYWKRYYSTDLGLIADIENINQGDFVINYALQEQIDVPLIFKDLKYGIALKNDHIAVSDSEKTRSETTYPFAKDADINIQEDEIISDFIVLSKIKSDLTIGSFQPQTIQNSKDSCPIIDTAESTDMKKISIISVSAELNSQKTSIESILKQYGKNPSATADIRIFLHYSKGNDFTIYYGNDVNELRAEKFACLFGKAYGVSFPGNKYDLKKYVGILDSEKTFADYLTEKSAKYPDELWIVLSESDAEKSINANDFSMIFENAVIEFYK